MALPVNIEALVNGRSVEWDRLEFKKGWNPKKVLHTMCAFANDVNNWGGGYIIVGIDETDGTPILPPEGISPVELDCIQKELLGLYYKIQPNYFAISQPCEFNGKLILVIWVPAGDNRVYTAPDNLGATFTREPYIRQGSQTIVARGENLRRLQELTARIPFDDRINQTANIDEYDLSLIHEFLKEVKSDLYEESKKMPFPELCRQMLIAKGADENLRPINAGLLLFTKDPSKYFDRTWIELVDHTKKAGGKAFSEKYFKGPIHHQLEKVLEYIESNVLKQVTLKIKGKAKADKFFNYPYEAIEEAISNAVYHKSYEIGKPIEIQIFIDKIEILSFPGPVPPVDAKILATQQRIVARDYRNRRIGDFLKELGLTEGRGTGIPLIYSSMEDNRSPLPVIETNSSCDYFLVTLPLMETYHYFDGSGDGAHDNGADVHTTRGIGDYDSDYDGDLDSDDESDSGSGSGIGSDSARILKVVKFCIDPKSREEIFSFLELTNHHKNYLKYMKPAIDEGWLEMTIPDKPKSKLQKYKTSPSGLVVINN